MRFILATLLLVFSALVAADHHLRDHHDFTWFLSEQGPEDCENVDPENPPSPIETGKPSSTCKGDGTEFCFCHKKASVDTRTWERRCGKCKMGLSSVSATRRQVLIQGP